MNRAIGIALFFLGVSFFTVLFISSIGFTVEMQKVTDYHYSTVHEIESSDFASTVIAERANNSKFPTTITEKSVKDDLRIYQVKTSTILEIPLFGFQTTYVKESIAR